MSDNNSTSSVNTVLIVIILLILVGFGVWWFGVRGGAGAGNTNDGSLNVDLNLPGGNGEENNSSDSGEY